MAKRASKKASEIELQDVEFTVMPPPKFDGVADVWRVAEAASTWTYVAALLQDVPSALRSDDGGSVHLSLAMDLQACFAILRDALRHGKIPSIADNREDLAADVVAVAREILEMDARGDLDQHGGCGVDALMLLDSGREALALAVAVAADDAGAR